MDRGLARRLEALRHRRLRLLSELEALSAAQLRHRPPRSASTEADPPPASGWCLLEIAEHLYLSERELLRTLTEERRAPPRRRLFDPARRALVHLVLATPQRVPAPTRRILPGEARDLAELRPLWEDVARGLGEALSHLGPRELRRPVLFHAYAGALGPGQALDLLRRHFDHHRWQIRRIRRSPTFPR